MTDQNKRAEFEAKINNQVDALLAEILAKHPFFAHARGFARRCLFVHLGLAHDFSKPYPTPDEAASMILGSLAMEAFEENLWTSNRAKTPSCANAKSRIRIWATMSEVFEFFGRRWDLNDEEDKAIVDWVVDLMCLTVDQFESLTNGVEVHRDSIFIALKYALKAADEYLGSDQDLYERGKHVVASAKMTKKKKQKQTAAARV